MKICQSIVNRLRIGVVVSLLLWVVGTVGSYGATNQAGALVIIIFWVLQVYLAGFGCTLPDRQGTGSKATEILVALDRHLLGTFLPFPAFEKKPVKSGFR